MRPTRLFLNILVDNPRAAASFYQQVFDMRVEFESAWFMHLSSAENSKLELGLLQKDNETVPDEALSALTGGMLTLVVEDADEATAKALQSGATLVREATDLFFGQRSAVVKAPDGTLLDLSSPCAPDPEWLKKVKQLPSGSFVEQD